MKVGTKIFSLLIITVVVGFRCHRAVTNAEETEESAADAVVHGPGFVDVDGDGYNDNAPDHDGDGIPNGQDPDWVQGAGNRNGNGHHKGWGRGQGNGMGRMRSGHGDGVRGFVDENGDGFNDLAPDHDGDGIPNGQDPDFVKGSGQGRHAGQGPNYTDADGDGRCDNRGDDGSTGSEDGNNKRGGGKNR